MDDYHDMTNADVLSGDEMREYDQADEALLDALEEERQAEEAAAGEQYDDEFREDTIWP
ncbi:MULTISPECIES: hypothetical protein [Streptomyces]|uniref:hypothetical protein n=1 Tax=Streptomyces TaxID=1883 RepID=UPI0013F4B28C|nr:MULTISPECIES: hypothetical protein [Streptomyces]MBT3077618.1 hypothetical protein [Streptomyces sp. COG21]MBT3084464.1 hypothetical protein [Streptomyces sp. COG20]MBT3085371.1 hypothetical protein [Streptomyces sp. CYG21]MBT3098963.1 hypothetical protein [Streptomyces sp. CBG30]MBT3103587.1 hypothetical protein [Streptomyces sp. COG19]